MPKIHRLAPHEAQKIAAGEVVERPANVAKELIENAIDAGATQISIYIEDGGKQLIRIVDNGCGMSPEDAHLAFEHHATSKITTVHDLATIATFGFRGEALSSISSVSKITLITKEEASDEGICLNLENGVVINQKAVSANTGTDIAIHDIFYNVPARKKFLKTTETEWRTILQLFHALCFDYTSIHFSLYCDGKQFLNCPATTDLKQRTLQLWDYHFSSHMIPLEPTPANNALKIHGIISNHHFARYDRSAIFFFVNSRWVKHQKLSNSLLKGYLNVIQPGRFPAACIFIEVNPAEIDVNIHPRKEEVLFLHPRRVETLLQETVKKTLEHNLSAQLKKNISFAPALPLESRQSFYDIADDYIAHVPRVPPVILPPAHSNGYASFDNAPHEQSSLSAPEITHKENFPQHTINTPSIHHEENAEVLPESFQDKTYTIIGQLNKTYILLEKEEGLYIVDQHAAHERILYELFSHRFDEIATVKLLFPQIITLSRETIKLLEPHLEIMTRNGIDIQIVSENQLAIQATPVHLKNQSLEDLIQGMISWIAEYHNVEQQEFFKALNEKIHAQMACKAAVKAGDILTPEHMEQLLNDLYKTNNRFTCPHGRPTGWLLSAYEIEKKFKRKV